MISIRTFRNVDLQYGSLLVLDIDETILKYSGICEQWWKEHFDTNYAKYGNYDDADNACVKDWQEHIKYEYPVHTDEDGFFDLIERANNLNCKVIIVTARDHGIKNITYEHLHHLGIRDIDVYFASGGNKGHMIDNVMGNEIHNYKYISFVDDKDYNLTDVKNHFGDKVICYKFEMDHECNIDI